MPVPATLWQPGMRITDTRLNTRDYQAGQLVVSFTNLASYTLPVTFPEPFPVAPIMNCEIAAGAGSTGRFEARPINVTATGWTLFVLITDAAEGPDTWVGVPVHWTARMPT
ncbi:hypothetical protein [Streptomyces sp. NBC_01237]|uniref:hypothetical protein n=1 Tax=Streptomyces sp. NBC_01237 TaxID=2903790 RepID=UPI002DDC62E4|nr:hypothetical protein [Streptomyces sp. NBC_01237]WRZ73772.1 hypothetical protein OG251_20240 [Streptomyces sp. NBC_01237]